MLLAYFLHQLLSIASAAAMLKHLHKMVFTKYPLRTEALGARQFSGQKQAFKVWSSREPPDGKTTVLWEYDFIPFCFLWYWGCGLFFKVTPGMESKALGWLKATQITVLTESNNFSWLNVPWIPPSLMAKFTVWKSSFWPFFASCFLGMTYFTIFTDFPTTWF